MTDSVNTTVQSLVFVYTPIQNKGVVRYQEDVMHIENMALWLLYNGCLLS